MTSKPRLSESRIVRAVAIVAAQRLTRRAIASLQKMRQTLSGDDSELKTTWDEICVQVQGEESHFWAAYQATMRDALAWDVEQLVEHEREALWLQSQAGEYWDTSDEDSREAYPVCNDDIIDYVVNEYLKREAGRWGNSRIRAYLEQAAFRD